MRVSFLLLILASGCATPTLGPGIDLKKVVTDTCQIAADQRTVKGSVWLKVKSTEASGQFPAMVRAVHPEKLELEVTDLIGQRQASIQIRGRMIRIEVPNEDEKIIRTGYGSWGGIPLRWAPTLFLGRLPCPSPQQLSRARFSRAESDGNSILVKVAGREQFEYSFKQWAGKPWPHALRWEKRLGGQRLAVDFRFERPDDKSHSPLKWEAKSKRGSVKARWRDRAAN